LREADKGPIAKAAERDLEIEVMKEITRKNGERTGPSDCGVLCD